MVRETSGQKFVRELSNRELNREISGKGATWTRNALIEMRIERKRRLQQGLMREVKKRSSNNKLKPYTMDQLMRM